MRKELGNFKTVKLVSKANHGFFNILPSSMQNGHHWRLYLLHDAGIHFHGLVDCVFPDRQLLLVIAQSGAVSFASE